jgi:hypothetical protein
MEYERRRDRRFPIHLPALFLPMCGLAHTEDISFGGLRMCLDGTRVTLDQLYRVEVCVARDACVQLHLVPVRRVAGARGRQDLVAVRILGHDLRWTQFVGEVRAHFAPPIVAEPDEVSLAKGVA